MVQFNRNNNCRKLIAVLKIAVFVPFNRIQWHNFNHLENIHLAIITKTKVDKIVMTKVHSNRASEFIHTNKHAKRKNQIHTQTHAHAPCTCICIPWLYVDPHTDYGSIYRPGFVWLNMMELCIRYTLHTHTEHCTLYIVRWTRRTFVCTYGWQTERQKDRRHDTR